MKKKIKPDVIRFYTTLPHGVGKNALMFHLNNGYMPEYIWGTGGVRIAVKERYYDQRFPAQA